MRLQKSRDGSAVRLAISGGQETKNRDGRVRRLKKKSDLADLLDKNEAVIVAIVELEGGIISADRLTHRKIYDGS